MARKRYVDLSGTIGASGLTNSATSHTFTAPLTYANGVTVPTLTGSDTFTLTILNAAGTAVSEVVKVTAYNSGTGAATLVRGQADTTGVSHASGDMVLNAALPDDFGGVGSGIIGYCYYAPSTTDVKSSTSTSSVDVDATNLAVTFVGPPSGLVEVTRSVVTHVTLTNNEHHWTLRSGSSDVAGGGAGVLATYQGAINAGVITAVVRVAVTPGTTYTWKWGWFRVGAGTGTLNLYCGDGHDLSAPAIIKVMALP